MSLGGHLETDGAVNALNSILVTASLGAQLAVICVTFEPGLTISHTLHLSASGFCMKVKYALSSIVCNP